MNKPLNMRQESFVREYVRNGGNAGKAYTIAYKCSNVKTMRTNSWKLLQDVRVTDAIRELYLSSAEYITEDMILKGINSIAYGDSSSNMEKLKALDLLSKCKGMQKEHRIIEERPSGEAAKGKARAILASLSEDENIKRTVTN